MPVGQRRLTSAEDMRALAHPLRLRLLELLGAEGAMTASEAARRVDESPANVSWHLRKLARHGFVRQGKGPGRERPWKVVGQSLTFGDDAADPAAASALTDVLLEREFQVLRGSLQQQSSESGEWHDATSVLQNRVWLTAEEARRIGELLHDVITQESLADRQQDPSKRPPGARLMAAMGWLVPCGDPADQASPAQTTQTEEAAR